MVLTNRLLLSVTLALILYAGIVFGMGVWSFWQAGPAVSDRLVMIDKGMGRLAIAHELQRSRVIRDPYGWAVLSFLVAPDDRLQAGEYLITARSSPSSIRTHIAQGRVYRRTLTFPEGLSTFAILARINAAEAMTGTITGPIAEGSMLPDTYDYRRGTDRNDFVERMRRAQTNLLDRLWAERAPDLPLATPGEAVILASIVEKETGVAQERARVAGVFINRLRIGMKLQSDPTVIYAITKGERDLGRPLLRRDIAETHSPFNTYRVAGLPPAPIANPGTEAIRATLQPEQHDYLYFVADGTGGHVFARTLAEHNRNAAAWRAVRDSALPPRTP